MSRVVAVEYVSLDGVMEDPSWTAPFWNDEIATYQSDQLFRSDALLLGRTTYQAFNASWPTRTDEGDGFTDRMNSLPKYVATRTLPELEWNSTPIEGDVPNAVAEMKQPAGGDLLIYGSAQLVRSLMTHNLIDEYRLLTYPVVLGKGQRLFEGVTDAPALKLADIVNFSSGVVSLVYEATE
jgi:dihydrofolate reductase